MPYDDYDFAEIYGLTPAHNASRLVKEHGRDKALERANSNISVIEPSSEVVAIVHQIRYDMYWRAIRDELEKL
jgi:hypothetical protein